MKVEEGDLLVAIQKPDDLLIRRRRIEEPHVEVVGWQRAPAHAPLSVRRPHHRAARQQGRRQQAEPGPRTVMLPAVGPSAPFHDVGDLDRGPGIVRQNLITDAMKIMLRIDAAMSRLRPDRHFRERLRLRQLHAAVRAADPPAVSIDAQGLAHGADGKRHIQFRHRFAVGRVCRPDEEAVRARLEGHRIGGHLG